MSSDRQGVLSQAWLILLLAAGFGAALAAVEVGWSGRIEANKRAETLRRIPALVLDSETAANAEIGIRGELIDVRPLEGGRLTLAVEESELAGYTVFAVHEEASRSLVGWVLRASDQGYADVIELLVGLSPDGTTLTGLFVLSQKETPGLGDAIRGERFRGQFVGQPTAQPLAVTRAAEGGGQPGEIVALTAATISSRSVCDLVNRAVADVSGQLERGAEAR